MGVRQHLCQLTIMFGSEADFDDNIFRSCLLVAAAG